MGSSLSSTLSTLPSLRDFSPPTPEAYITLLNIWQYFPLVTIVQWLTSWHPAGKGSSKNSLFNLPGRIGWFIMEITGPVNLLYVLSTLPPKLNIHILPLPNKLLAGLYVLHYLNRAVISPFFAAPSMSPIHAFIVIAAMAFNWVNSTCLAAWLVGYNVTTVPGYYPSASADGLGLASPEKVLEESLTSTAGTSLMLPTIGLVLFFTGMVGNIHSERTLFRLRREAAEKQTSQAASKKDDKRQDPEGRKTNKYAKVYTIPPASGVFSTILYPHYVFEWLEWTGFALLGTTVFPTLTSPSIIPDVLSTSSAPPPKLPPSALYLNALSGFRSKETLGLGFEQGLQLAPWLRPIVWAAGKLRVPVLPLPAIIFVVNAVANMLPHARWGRKWYVERFGEGQVKGRGAAVPFVPWL
ncbi:hypothetical protein BJY04DRAFT_110329 [Aspergillus karnatakaensis]|uniref:3-oxo-5-alpha-steroid 4-dehydrogenase family protein n=1 Tax=Aspergillus karnatakaensis TaxID=1810916 RepID=UPI003CCCC93B